MPDAPVVSADDGDPRGVITAPEHALAAVPSSRATYLMGMEVE
ncbi:MAG TPA: hypothetical protein VF391_15190 [Dermatophilaceae bacterium]